MTPQQIAHDIERGRELISEIDARKAELKEIEARLKLAAQDAPHLPLECEEREGRQALLRSEAHVLPVRFTADSLVATVDADSQLHQQLQDIAGDKLPLFYAASTKLARVPKDGVEFRRTARAHLLPEACAALISASLQRDKSGIPRSSTVIAWDDLRPNDFGVTTPTGAAVRNETND